MCPCRTCCPNRPPRCCPPTTRPRPRWPRRSRSAPTRRTRTWPPGFPAYSAAWATLASRALAAGQPVAAYAYARTGYHRGLDQLRRNGWKGHGPVPWSHEPNRGFLRCLHALSRAADEIGESDEAARCAQFLRDCDPAAGDALS